MISVVLDSYAVLALLKGEPSAADVQTLIEGGECALTPLGAAEIVDHLIRLVGVDEEDAILDVAELGLADPTPLTPTRSIRAGLLRARHYHRRNRAVSLADCVLAQTALELDAAVATSDPHLLALCHDEGIRVVALADSKGAVWSP